MFEFAVLCPTVYDDPALAIAACRAGALGIADLQYTADTAAALGLLERLAAQSRRGWGVQVDRPEALEAVLGAGLDRLETVVLGVPDAGQLPELVAGARRSGVRVWAVAGTVATALAAEDAGVDALIAKGHESGGWVGPDGSMVLLQRLARAVTLPIWAQGGIGLHTVAAAYAAGVVGVVLDAQVLLARESPLGREERDAVTAMDGSETATFGTELGATFRALDRPHLEPVRRLRAQEAALAAEGAHDDGAWRAAVTAAVGDGTLARGLLPLGQDAAFAAGLARRFGTVAGILDGLRAATADARAALRGGNPLAADAPLAQSHGTRYPIVQGPMTRVSDRAEFAVAVARSGGLPFLALALMRADDADALLGHTAELLGDRPWGVGILGFVPAALRAEQLAVVRAHRPPFALIAGGRPDQAAELEAEGTRTYLHVPSPGLLTQYLAQGARRFVFEGRECGGHVGPRTSFALWETMLGVLQERLPAADRDCHVLFAGGIHDARSATMVAVMAARTARRGVRVGALLGTAYLFTREATETGAITETFQRAAISGEETALLQSGPGHATRCLHSPFVGQFEAERRRLHAGGGTPAEVRNALEQLNIGRLRIAAKGLDRNPRAGEDRAEPKLAPVTTSDQWQQGLYMIGSLTSLRDEVVTMAALHRDVSDGSGERVGKLASAPRRRESAPAPAEVAIIGHACILPGAPDATTFWANILDKVDAIREVPAERWEWQRIYDPDPAARDKVYSRWGGFIDPVPFDPVAFGLPPKTLSSIEPFQLLALLTAQAALADAGYGTRPFARERTSVILGAGGGGADLSVGYTVRSALPALFGDDGPDAEIYDRLPEWTEDSFAGLLMNVAAGRIANRLDLGGANYTVDAACASSLAAISLATRELQAATSDMVLAGGVDAIQNPFAYLCFSKTHALSPRGRCRPFDASADGIAISEGFATVVLKRLADAERDGDRIYAVIRGVGAASDGRDRSLTAPRPEGQMRALRRAYAHAGISPATVGLVEAHGTGTVAGDSAEVQALSTVLAEESAVRQSCAIGSVKSMIGHTKATAGVAGLIKASLALHHRVLPPTIGVTEPNPRASSSESPLYVNTEARPWLTGGAAHPRRAGVSAFGFGGTDFHVVLEEYEGAFLHGADAAVSRWPAELLLWRGPREEIASGLDAVAATLAAGETGPLPELAQRLATAARGRHGAGLALVTSSPEDLAMKLTTARELVADGAVRTHRPDGIHWTPAPLAPDGKVAFLFPGQGSQTVDMARELALAFPEARGVFELADRVLDGCYPEPLSRFVFPPPAFSPEERGALQQALTDTHVAQAALGASDLAYLRVLAALGVEPGMTAGHSYGELVALAAAGALEAADLLVLSEARGRFMREAAADDAGAMLAVEATADRLAPLTAEATGGQRVIAANLNAPTQTVLSGPRARIQEALEWCREREITARLLPVACAFHSPLVAGARERFAETLAGIRILAPRLPVYSNTTGAAHSGEPEEIVAVLSRHLAEPVRFVNEIEAMHADGARLFVEVGPRSVLTGLVSQILGSREHVAVAVDQPGRPGLHQLTQCLAALASEGVELRHDRLLRGRAAGAHAAPPSAASAGRGPRFIVDGGSIRPAPTEQPPEHPPTEESSIVSTHNGAVEVAPPPPVVMPPPVVVAPAVAAPAPSVVLPPVAAAPVSSHAAPGGSVDVMAHYQVLMQQFLQMQRDVMLGYLGASPPATPGGAVVAALPALAPPAVAPPAIAPPTPAAVAPPTPPAIAPPTPPAIAPPTPPAVAPAPPPAAAPPTPSPAPVDSPSNGAGGDHHLTREQIETRVLQIVGERTGYPPELLTLEGDLEGDLGIDSIKRVEIAGAFAETLAPEVRGRIDMEELTTSRTLHEVIEVIERGLASAPAPAQTLPFDCEPAETERVGRFVVQSVSAPSLAAAPRAAVRGAVVIVDDDSGVGTSLAARLAEQGTESLLLAASEGPSDRADAATLAARLSRDCTGIGALVHLAGSGADDGGLRTLFLLAQALGDALHAAAASGGAAVLAVTRLGGMFGVDGVAEGAAGQGAVSGFVKALAIEWPDVRVRAVDLPSAPDAAADGRRIAAELVAGDEIVEVGYAGEARTTLALAPAPTAQPTAPAPALGADGVVLVTGGARGITAEVAVRLAAAYRPTLVVVGRTPDEPESPESAAFPELAQLRAGLIEARRRRGDPLTPALVERECRRILRGREVRANLERLRATGARVEYRTCDVGDPDACAALIDDVYTRHGRIDGVVHGAGLIEDRLVADKELDSLERVMATKAGSARTLASRLRPESLRFLVMFGSVSGRFGNRGQADYGAASEMLSKLSRELDGRWPARVVTIDWGPWRSTGMVSPALEQELARRGVALIETEQGCRLLMDELVRGVKGEAEVVIGGRTGLEARPNAGPRPALALLGGDGTALQAGAGGSSRLTRAFTVARDRYLDDHRVDGRAVLPFAGAMELMAELGVLTAPELSLRGLERIQLFTGVTVPDDGELVLELTATPGEAAGELVATIGVPDQPRPSYRARVVLGDPGTAADAPVLPAALEGGRPFPMPVEDAYRELLFHGPLFQRIEAIDGLDERGSTALLRPSDPGACVAGAAGRRWLLDPVLLDAALQVQVIWARLEWDVTLLPAEIDGYTWHADAGPDEPVRHEMRIRSDSLAPRCRADHWFLGSDGRLLATLHDVVGVGSRSLNRLAEMSHA